MKLLDRLLGRKPKQETRTTTYTASHRNYWVKNREKINEYQKVYMRKYRADIKKEKEAERNTA